MLKLRTVTGPHCKQPEGSTIEVGYVQCYAMNVSQVRKVLHATGSYGRLYRLRKVHNPYRSGYAWLRVWLCRLVYTQVCEHWLCASYARLHDPTVSSPFDDNELVMQCYAMNVSRSPCRYRWLWSVTAVTHRT